MSTLPVLGRVRLKSALRSAARSPSAQSTPGAGGISTRGMPNSSARAQPCSGPAPPNGTRVKSRGSWPRSTETMRSAPIMLLSMMASTPRAASSGVRPSGRATSPIDRAAGGLGVERHAAAQQARRQLAQHDVGVGHRRLGAAAAVGGGPGLGAGALRAHRQRAAGDPGDRAAAGADGHHVDHGQRQRPFADMAVLGERDLAVLDQADVGAGAADIDGDDVPDAAGVGHVARADHAGRRSRQRRQRRRAPDGRAAGDAAVRLHVKQRSRPSPRSGDLPGAKRRSRRPA